ncbi:universal stress protein [Nonomuraea jabiensis]|uniref:universal stress protein n=1 Tax=Nonomuraea jabiensis TaxID=882448 RepID=UPI003690FE42
MGLSSHPLGNRDGKDIGRHTGETGQGDGEDAWEDIVIVVSVDGSQASLVAVEWAAHEAAMRGVAVHLVHAWKPVNGGRTSGPRRRTGRSSATPGGGDREFPRSPSSVTDQGGHRGDAGEEGPGCHGPPARP